jgi:cytochrome c-type biogenesis protein CcmH
MKRAILLAAWFAAIVIPANSKTPPADEARRIESRFLAPCCWSENLALHNSPTAEAMRAEIVKFVSEGRSESQIVEYYVAKYGKRILREPEGTPWIVLMLVPVLALVGGTIFLVRFLRRDKSAARTVAAPGGITVSEEELDW